jgi:hypothetical protein
MASRSNKQMESMLKACAERQEELAKKSIVSANSEEAQRLLGEVKNRILDDLAHYSSKKHTILCSFFPVALCLQNTCLSIIRIRSASNGNLEVFLEGYEEAITAQAQKMFKSDEDPLFGTSEVSKIIDDMRMWFPLPQDKFLRKLCEARFAQFGTDELPPSKRIKVIVDSYKTFQMKDSYTKELKTCITPSVKVLSDVGPGTIVHAIVQQDKEKKKRAPVKRKVKPVGENEPIIKKPRKSPELEPLEPSLPLDADALLDQMDQEIEIEE